MAMMVKRYLPANDVFGLGLVVLRFVLYDQA